MLKLVFPNGENGHVVLDDTVTIGSGVDDCVRLFADGLMPGHAQVRIDGRGITLTIADGAPDVTVNYRQVQHKAILRPGDILHIVGVQVVLRGTAPAVSGSFTHEKDDHPAGEAATKMRSIPPQCSLRGVSGDYFGRVIPLFGQTVFGRSGDCTVVLSSPEISRRHASIENGSDGLFLRDMGSANGSFVNGNPVDRIFLNPGDQIAFDTQRFVVEAPNAVHVSGVPMEKASTPGSVESSTTEMRPWLYLAAGFAATLTLLWLIIGLR